MYTPITVIFTWMGTAKQFTIVVLTYTYDFYSVVC